MRVRRLPDWQVFLGTHTLFVALALVPFLSGACLYSAMGIWHSYPFFELFSFHNLLSGEVFMNRLGMNGFPSFVPVGFSLHPLTYVFNTFLPPFTDLHWFVFTIMAAGGVLCSLLLRRLGISRLGAMVGGACYVTGSWWLTTTLDYAPSMTMLPLIPMVLLQSRTRPVLATFWGALLSGYIWFGVNAQMSLMIFTAFGVGALALAMRESVRGWRAALRPVVVLFLSLAAGTLLGIPKVIPSLVYGSLSWRAGGLSLAEAGAGGLRPLTAVTYLFPYISFPFLNFGCDLLQVYIGAFGFMFLLVGFWIAFSRRSNGAVSGLVSLRWWVVAYVVVLAFAFYRSPLVALLHSFPPFSFFRGPGRWTILSSFVAAPIIGMAFDALVQGRVERMRRVFALLFGVVAAFISIAFAVVQLSLQFFSGALITIFQRYFAYFHSSLHLGPPLSYYETFVERRIHEFALSPIFLQPRTFFPFISIVILAVVLQDRVWEKARHRAVLLVTCSLLTSALTLIWFDRPFPRNALPKGNPVEVFLQGHPGTVLDVFSNGTAAELAPGYRFSKGDELVWTFVHHVPNTNLLSGIHMLDYFDNLASRRPSALASWVGAATLPTPSAYQLVAFPGTTADKIREFGRRKDVLDMQGVRYLTSSFSLNGASLRNVFETRVTSANIPLYIYENPAARPSVYFADSVETMAEDESEALERIFHEQWHGRRSLLECEPACSLQTSSGRGEIETVEDRPQFLTLQTQAAEPQWLVVTIPRLPGWEVRIDGEVANSVYANAAFFGIPVPAGSHTVTLRYSVPLLLKEGVARLLTGGYNDVF
ncbi:MAG: YfhO family protein [Candidatus Peribacteraceae bacterium]